jgi:hypothetical protein
MDNLNFEPINCIQLTNDLSKDFYELYKSKKNCDTKIYLKNDKISEAHSIILSACSRYFKTALSDDWAEKENGYYIIDEKEVDKDIIEIILKYIYSGKLEFEKKQIFQLFITVERLLFDRIIDFLIKYISVNINDLLSKNLKECLDLLNYPNIHLYEIDEIILKEICYDPPKNIFESSDLNKDILEKIIKRDDLNMEEYDIFIKVTQ